MTFAPGSAGDVVAHELTDGELLLEKGAYLASSAYDQPRLADAYIGMSLVYMSGSAARKIVVAAQHRVQQLSAAFYYYTHLLDTVPETSLLYSTLLHSFTHTPLPWPPRGSPIHQMAIPPKKQGRHCCWRRR